MRPSIVFSAISTHSRSGQNIFLYVFDEFSSLRLSQPQPLRLPRNRASFPGRILEIKRAWMNQGQPHQGLHTPISSFSSFLIRAYPFATSRSRVSCGWMSARCRRFQTIRSRGREECRFFFFFFSLHYRDTISRISGSRIPPGILLLPDWFLRFDDYVYPQRDSMVLESNNRSQHNGDRRGSGVTR